MFGKKKLAFFSKTNVMIIFSKFGFVFESKTPFFAKFFGENI
jgi:hypothetical protein